MTAQQKANELIRKFAIDGWGKANALNCADEVLRELKELEDVMYVSAQSYPNTHELISDFIFFWFDVKSELKKQL
jgi:hypothetical protein